MTDNINNLILENKILKIKVQELEKKLKKYTNPERNRKYYHNNKEKIKSKKYKSNYKPSKEQRRIYNKRYREKKEIRER